jgi:hypothetical protein
MIMPPYVPCLCLCTSCILLKVKKYSSRIFMDRQQQILTWASAFVLGISLGRWLRQCRDSVRNQFQSIAARSALWIAALRAVESLENDDALFVDDMASSLAGKGAFGRALKMARVRWVGMIFSYRNMADDYVDIVAG